MEHVAHVESVATTIAQNLGLNIDLVRAIALGYDIGHNSDSAKDLIYFVYGEKLGAEAYVTEKDARNRTI